MPRKRIPEAVSIRQTAELIGVHEKTIRRWIRCSYLKAYRVGPILIRIPRSEISRLRRLRLAFDESFDKPQYPTV